MHVWLLDILEKGAFHLELVYPILHTTEYYRTYLTRIQNKISNTKSNFSLTCKKFKN